MTEAKHVWEPLRKACPQVDWLRLENLVGTGQPDVNGCLNGVDAWVENKVVKGHRIIFRPKQPAWLIRRMLHGGRVFVLARREDIFLLYGGRGLSDLLHSMWPLADGDLVADWRAAQPVLVMAKPWDWELFLQCVFGHKACGTLKAA